MLRALKVLCVLIVLGGGLVATPAAHACPMCKTATENDLNPGTENRPKAYMYSILFMISMPATIFTGFAITFYRLSKKQQEINAEIMANESL